MNNILLIQYGLIFGSIAAVGIILYIFSNRFFLLGYSRGKKVLKNFRILITNRIKKNSEQDDFIDFVKEEVFRLIAKPSKVDMASRMIKEVDAHLLVLEKNKELNFANLQNEYVSKIELIEKEYSNDFNFFKEAMAINQKKIDEINTKKEAFQSELKLLETQLLQEASEFDQKFDANREQTKVRSIINSILEFCKKCIKNFSQDFLAFTPIFLLIIFIVIDFSVGFAFTHQQFEAKLDSSTNMAHILLQILVYGISIMIFLAALLAFEFARKSLDIHNNFFVRAFKWFMGSIIIVLGFLGIFLFFGATRFFQGQVELQNLLEMIAIIMIWLLVIFMSSLLIKEIDRHSGFKPLVSVLAMVISILLFPVLVFFYLVSILEFIPKYTKQWFKTRSQKIKRIEQNKHSLEKYLNEYDEQITVITNSINLEKIKNNREDKISLLEKNTEETRNKMTIEFEKKNNKLKKKLNYFWRIIGAFRSGCSHAVNNNFESLNINS